MILLISSSARAQECAQALQEATSEPTEAAATLRQAAAQLRARDYSAVVIDQSVLEANPEESEALLLHMGTAIPVFVNFAISGIARVTRELRIALQRRKRESTVLRKAAKEEIRNELKGPVTALMVSCEMALRLPALPAAAETKLHAMYELAREMHGKLGNTE